MTDDIRREELAKKLPEQWKFHHKMLRETESMMRSLGIPLPGEEPNTMTIPEACIRAFQGVKSPMTVENVTFYVSLYRKRNTPLESVRTALSRDDRFKRFGTNTYGLSEWECR